MELARPVKVADRDDRINIAVVVPARGVADVEFGACRAAKLFPPARVAQLWREISLVPEKRDTPERFPAFGVAGTEIRLRPVGHKNGTGQPSCVAGILHDVDMRSGVRKSVGHDIGDEETARRAERRRQAPREAHDDSLVGDFMHKVGREAAAPQESPRLKNPALGACDFAALLQGHMFADFPRTLFFGAGQVVAGQIKRNAHELLAR